MNENQKHQQAFQYFYSLQGDRDMQKVADKFGVSIKTAYKWSSNFGWKDRVEELDKKTNQKLEDKAVDTVVKYKENCLKVLNKAVEVFSKNLDDGKVKIQDVQTLDKLVDIYGKLTGEGQQQTGAVNVNVNSSFSGMSDDDLDKMLKNLK